MSVAVHVTVLEPREKSVMPEEAEHFTLIGWPLLSVVWGCRNETRPVAWPASVTLVMGAGQVMRGACKEVSGDWRKKI